MQEAQKIENQRAEAERTIQQQNAQDEALQAYLDQMSTLLLEKDLRASEAESEVRTLARTQTLAVLARLNASRKTAVMEFLEEAELVRGVAGGMEPIIPLADADLSNTDLPLAGLRDADLRGNEGLLQASSLKGATMPNGQKYEDWIKSQGTGEDGENE